MPHWHGMFQYKIQLCNGSDWVALSLVFWKSCVSPEARRQDTSVARLFVVIRRSHELHQSGTHVLFLTVTEKHPGETEGVDLHVGEFHHNVSTLERPLLLSTRLSSQFRSKSDIIWHDRMVVMSVHFQWHSAVFQSMNQCSDTLPRITTYSKCASASLLGGYWTSTLSRGMPEGIVSKISQREAQLQLQPQCLFSPGGTST